MDSSLALTRRDGLHLLLSTDDSADIASPGRIRSASFGIVRLLAHLTCSFRMEVKDKVK